jgi:hypothetical protein
LGVATPATPLGEPHVGLCSCAPPRPLSAWVISVVVRYEGCPPRPVSRMPTCLAATATCLAATAICLLCPVLHVCRRRRRARGACGCPAPQTPRPGTSRAACATHGRAGPCVCACACVCVCVCVCVYVCLAARVPWRWNKVSTIASHSTVHLLGIPARCCVTRCRPRVRLRLGSMTRLCMLTCVCVCVYGRSSCGHVTSAKEPFTCLSLPLPPRPAAGLGREVGLQVRAGPLLPCHAVAHTSPHAAALRVSVRPSRAQLSGGSPQEGLHRLSCSHHFSPLPSSAPSWTSGPHGRLPAGGGSKTCIAYNVMLCNLYSGC